MVYYMQRTVVGAPGMSTEAAEYYNDLFTKVFNSAEMAGIPHQEESAG